MKHVFGPVPSRRLGQSLGVDPIPFKTCNWNCVYCQLGRSVPMTNERKAYYPREEILADVRQALVDHPGDEIDWITFVGSGEPTLHSDIGWLIRQVKALTPKPVAVCTNGALLYIPEVRQELKAADAIMPTVAAGTAHLYWRIHRPYPGLTFERLIQGLIDFRREFSGQLWPEVMLIKDLNDHEAALRDIAQVLARIKPDQVHISLPARPPAETWVEPPDAEGLMRAMAILGQCATIIHPAQGTFDVGGYESIVEAIIGIVTRHPMSQADVEQVIGQWAPERLDETLAELAASGRAQLVERYGTMFWSATPAHYPDEASSLAVLPERLDSHLRPHQREAGQDV
ncbi:MAG: radical SAM protein [Candidatus Promineifilaceae bacterium]